MGQLKTIFMLIAMQLDPLPMANREFIEFIIIKAQYNAYTADTRCSRSLQLDTCNVNAFKNPFTRPQRLNPPSYPPLLNELTR